MRGPFRDVLRVLGLLALLLAAPHALGNSYYLSVLILGGLNAMVAVGLSLLLGFAGQISLGHAAFLGIAAYTSAIATATYGLPVIAGAALALLFAGVVAWLLAVPTLKLTGHYLAMATLGFGVIVSIVLNQAVELTGGPSGFVGIPRFEVGGFLFNSEMQYYMLVASVLSLLVLLALNLVNSRAGRALLAIHASEKAAQVCGVDVAATKRFVFVLSALYAAVSGVLYAHYLEFIAPGSFGFHHSVLLITMVVLGGMDSVWGAVAGAFFLTALPELLHAFEDIETLVYGGILILTMMFLPQGLAGGVSGVVHKLNSLTRRTSRG